MEQSEISRIGRILKERRLQLDTPRNMLQKKQAFPSLYSTKIGRVDNFHLWKLPILSKTFSLSMDRWL